MKKIDIALLNPEAAQQAERIMVCAARLTQRGHKIKNLDDFLELYNQPYKESTIEAMCKLPHPTIQKLGVINVVICGASRRFLAQITRHQNEVKFISASLQYSNYSGEAGFVVPYEVTARGGTDTFLKSCKNSMGEYKAAVETGLDNDSAGYLAPQALRNVLIISATPYQWKHMISQRVCRRNTSETRYVMLRIWRELYELAPEMFSCGPFCMKGTCQEGKMCCGHSIRSDMTPADIISADFPLLVEGAAKNG